MAATSVSAASVGTGCIAVRRASHPRAGVSCGRHTRARRGPARPPDTNPRRHRPAAVSPFAEDDAAPTGGNEPDSPALDRAKRALAWRASSRAAAADAAATRCPDLDVYTEALLATLGEDWRARAPDQEGAAAEGFSSAGISTALDHLAFERLQALMEKFEVSKAVEVFGTMRQVVVTGAGSLREPAALRFQELRHAGGELLAKPLRSTPWPRPVSPAGSRVASRASGAFNATRAV